jgi:hypothetical protein
MFFGIIIYMYVEPNEPHHEPHIHARYSGKEAIFSLSGKMLTKGFPRTQAQFVRTWIMIHESELKANWELVSNGQPFFRIDPLK